MEGQAEVEVDLSSDVDHSNVCVEILQLGGPRLCTCRNSTTRGPQQCTCRNSTTCPWSCRGQASLPRCKPYVHKMISEIVVYSSTTHCWSCRIPRSWKSPLQLAVGVVEFHGPGNPLYNFLLSCRISWPWQPGSYIWARSWPTSCAMWTPALCMCEFYNSPWTPLVHVEIHCIPVAFNKTH